MLFAMNASLVPFAAKALEPAAVSSRRKKIALVLAGVADLVQLGWFPVFGEGAVSPSPALKTFAISSMDSGSPETAMNRSPAAAFDVIARRCRSAASRTSTRPKYVRGAAGIPPVSIVLMMSMELE